MKSFKYKKIVYFCFALAMMTLGIFGIKNLNNKNIIRSLEEEYCLYFWEQTKLSKDKYSCTVYKEGEEFVELSVDTLEVSKLENPLYYLNKETKKISKTK